MIAVLIGAVRCSRCGHDLIPSEFIGPDPSVPVPASWPLLCTEGLVRLPLYHRSHESQEDACGGRLLLSQA